METWLEGKRLRVPASRLLGKGGEAEVFDLRDGRALKLFKPADHPDLAGDPAQQAAARERLALHQRKLPAFPAGLPPSVVVPAALARSGPGTAAIAGYAMRLVQGAEPLLRWSEPSFRRAGASAAQVQAIFRALHATLEGLHARGVVVGDFNDLNVLVLPATAEPLLIDADSFQFGGFPCPVFTERFLDPRLVAEGQGPWVPSRPFDPSSDWFAYAALLVQSLLLVGPWGGVHRPPDPARAIPPGRRALARHSIFRGEVQLPKVAAPPEALPDALLHELSLVFDRDERRPLPLGLLEALTFARCPSCSLEHARASCPRCRPHAAAPLQTVVAARGRATARTVLETRGELLAFAAGEGGARWLVHERGAWRREDGVELLQGALDPSVRAALCGPWTALARGGHLALLKAGQPPRSRLVDVVDGEPVFGANGRHLCWLQDGRVLCVDPSAPAPLRGLDEPDLLGEVVPGRTRLFLGPRFGLALTRAGGLSLAASFVPGRRGLLEGPRPLPPLQGHLLGVRTAFSDTRVWLSLALRWQGRTRHRLLGLDPAGALVAEAEAGEGDGSWLGEGPELCAAGDLLFAATDAGLLRLEARGGRLVEGTLFGDTAALLEGGARPQMGAEGLWAASRQRLALLTVR